MNDELDKMTEREIGSVGWFVDLISAVHERGYASETDWSESIKPPANPEALAQEAIFVICNSGMKAQIAQGIFERVMERLRNGNPIGDAFGHAGKVGAIEHIWSLRGHLFDQFNKAIDKVEWCGGLPWIGPITKWHLAKNLGDDCAKPDRHLERVSAAAGCTCESLCRRLSEATGYRVATIDVVIWRAANLGIIDTHSLRAVAGNGGGR